MGTVFVTVQTPHDPRYEGVAKLSGAIDLDRYYPIVTTGSVSRDFEEPEKQLMVCTMSTALLGTAENQTRPGTSPPFVGMIDDPVFIATGAKPYSHFISIWHCVFGDPRFPKGGTIIEPLSHIIGPEGIRAWSHGRQ